MSLPSSPRYGVRLFWCLVLVLLALRAGRAQAQLAAGPSADCIIGMLGQPAAADSVRAVLAAQGIDYRDRRVEASTNISLPRQGVLLKVDSKGRIATIVMLNDSVIYEGVRYRRFVYPMPYNFTFADSLGVEENIILRQPGTRYGEEPEGGYSGNVLCTSNGTSFRFYQAYVPAYSYFQAKRARPGSTLRRTPWYRFEYEPRLRGRYVRLPSSCPGAMPETFGPAASTTARDSAYYFMLRISGRQIANSGKAADQLSFGSGVGLEILFPFGRRNSPPIHQTIVIDYLSYSYKNLTTINSSGNNSSAPSQGQIGVGYGFTYIPKPQNRSFYPYGQLLGGAMVDFSGRVPLETAGGLDRSNSTSSASLFYQIGGGVGYRTSVLVVQVGVVYRGNTFSRFLNYDPNSADDPLQVAGQSLQTVGFQIGVGLNLNSVE